MYQRIKNRMTITKVLEENRDNLHNTEFCNYFLDMTLKHRPKGWQKISANHLSDRELIIRIYVYIYIYICHNSTTNN